MMDEISTKDKILNFASTILQQRGYNGFSYGHIAAQLGIRNAAIHYHFPSKADLGAALIIRYQKHFVRWITHNEQKHAKNYQTLFEAYITISRSFIQQQDSICPLAVLESNYTVFPEKMQLLTQTLTRDIRKWFSTLLNDGKTAGIFKFNGSANNKSILISAALQGASMMALVESAAVFEATVVQIKHEIGLTNETA